MRALTGRGITSFGFFLLTPLFVGGCGLHGEGSRWRHSNAQQFRQDLHIVITEARDKVFPALVHINVVNVDYWDGKEHKSRAVGSGTIISNQGHVLSNYHVTHQGKKFTCTLADRQELPAELIGEDSLTDLAVLKLNLSKYQSDQPLPIATFGNSDEVQVGDYVMAMGSPFALSRSVTLGIISNTHRVFTDSDGDAEDMEIAEGQTTGLFTRWIQHDAAINPGNSGGPLINLQGQIIGINELGSSGMGFAIPSNLSQRVTRLLIDKQEVVRSWFGFSLRPIQHTGLKLGVLVNSVIKDSPAAKAGIQPGDVITQVDGDAITVRFVEEAPLLLDRLASMPIGSPVTIEYLRNGQPATTTMTSEKMQEKPGDEKAFRAWGLTARQITPNVARNMRLENPAGAQITSTHKGGPAQIAEPPIETGDIIRSLDHQPIKTLDELTVLYDRITSMDPLPEWVLVEFERQGNNMLTLIRTKPEQDEDSPREVRKAWIGIATQPVLRELASKLGNEKGIGYRISRVYPKTNAATVDLKVGDIITAVNDRQLRPKGMEDTGLLARLVRKLDMDGKAKLSLLRDGKELVVEVSLEPTRLTPEEAQRDRNRDFDITVREVTFFDRDTNRWDEEDQGVIVENVESAGWAGLGGLSNGDLIQKIGTHEITSLANYRNAMKAVTKEQSERVVFRVLRGAHTRFIYVEPEWKPTVNPSSQPADTQPHQE